MADSATDALDQQAIKWLLTSDEPGIVMQTRRDLLGENVNIDAAEITAGPIVSGLLAGQHDDGSFGVDQYQKWMGGHWRLVSLVELGVTTQDSRVEAALDAELDWIASSPPPEAALRIHNRYRVHGSIYANALAVASALGRASDERAREVARWLVMWQWADGGWNCDRHAPVNHSSFYESVTPLWALSAFARATGDKGAADAAARTAEYFLAHRVFKSHRAERLGDHKWVHLRYPEYWHFDYLHGLVMLQRAGALSDPRTTDALQLLREQQKADGRWVVAGQQYWKSASGQYGDPAHWSHASASQMLTLNALRVLRAAGA